MSEDADRLPEINDSQRAWLEEQWEAALHHANQGTEVLFESSRQGALLSTGVLVAGCFADFEKMGWLHLIALGFLAVSTLASIALHYLWGIKLLKRGQSYASFLHLWRRGMLKQGQQFATDREKKNPEWSFGLLLGHFQAITLVIGLLMALIAIMLSKLFTITSAAAQSVT